MSTSTGRPKGLKGFEQLDLGELYFIGSRRTVNRGLAYFRQFAVESLEWDERSQRIIAQVAGSQRIPYEVSLWVEGDRLAHECDCAAWGQYDAGCKHVVAATAAVFLAVQGKSLGNAQLPEDYAKELRSGLGYPDEIPDQPAVFEEMARPKTTLQLTEFNTYGSLTFRIKGPVPRDFLYSVGVTLPSDFGYYDAREFRFGSSAHGLKSFFRKADAAGIELRVKIHGQYQPLRLTDGFAWVRVEYDFTKGSVRRRICFSDQEGDPLEPYALIEGTAFVVLDSGEVREIQAESLSSVGELGPLHQTFTTEAFNEVGYRVEVSPESPVLKVDGRVVDATRVDPEASSLALNLGIWKNAAQEPEELEFELSFKLDDCSFALTELTTRCLAPLTQSYAGGIFSAKRRVRDLMSLVRQVFADGLRESEFDLSYYREQFPELSSNEYRGVVTPMIRNLLTLLEAYRDDRTGLALDTDGVAWLSYQPDVSALAMLLYSIADVTNRKELTQLSEGKIAIVRGQSGMDQVQRVVTAARVLGVDVRFEDKPIRSRPLSISVDTRAAGSDIDWFALHPSIRCGERTIQASEWRELIQGQLMLKGEDGSLILPEVEGDSKEGLQVLASLLQERAGSVGERLQPKTEFKVSRLEMLDWILLRRLGVQMDLPEEAEALFRSLAGFETIPDFELPKSLRADLRAYQVEGCAWIEFLYQHRFGACLADDMGLGKTVQAIGFIAHRLQSSKNATAASVMIVLPPSLVFNWLDEFARFAPDIKVVECLKKSDWANALAGAEVILTTYDRMRIDLGMLKAHTFDIVVFDEAHNLKTVGAARTKAAAQVNRRFTLCLTGTPVENNASEFYSVLSMAVPGIFGTIKNFKEMFRLTPDRVTGRAKPFILRRTKQAILTELPSKEEHELFLEMSSVQKEIYTRTVVEVREEVAKAYDGRPEQQAGIVALAAILRLRQVCVSPELLGKTMPEPAPKFGYMADKLEELAAEGHAALVFSQFIGGLDQMEEVARSRGLSYLRMDGRTPVAERKEIVRSFQSEKGPAFFFISLKTGGVGLNLTRANYVFHLDPWWNPAVENQASDRAHRIGQTRSVFVQRLIMQHSIEARMLELKARKAELFQRLVDQPGAKTAASGLSRDDFNYLLEW